MILSSFSDWLGGISGQSVKLPQKILKDGTDAFFSAFMDHSTDGIVVCDVKDEGSLVYINDAACQLLGHSRDFLVTMGAREFRAQFKPLTTQPGKGGLDKEFPFVRSSYLRSSGQSLSFDLSLTQINRDGQSFDVMVIRPIVDLLPTLVDKLEVDERLEVLAANVAEMMAILDLAGRYTYVSPASEQICGLAPSQLIGHYVQEFVHVEDWPDFWSALQATSTTTSNLIRRYRRFQPDGTFRWVETSMRAVKDESGQTKEYIVSVRDISDRVRQEKQDALRSRFFELMIKSSRLDDILEVLLDYMEASSIGLVAGIALANEAGHRIRYYGSKHIPQSFIKDTASLNLSSDVGSVGAALASGQRFIVDNIETHPNYVPLRTQCANAGFRSAVSEPIKDDKGNVMGVITAYRPVAKQPSPEDLSTLEAVAEFTSLAILRRRSEEELQLALSVYNGSKDAIVVTDAKNRIVKVNPAFSAITGYGEDEVIGHDPKILSAGRTDRKTYHDMWRDLNQHGAWQGEILNRRKDGKEFYEWLTISVIKNEHGYPSRYVGMFADITEWKSAQDVIVRQANFDTLTGLPNRRLFRDRLEYEMKRMDRDHGQMVLMFLDLDRFKEVNDTLGHDAGDQLLIEASQRMVGCVRISDTVARLGGDEFAIILAGIPNAQLAERIAGNLISALETPFMIKAETAHVSASIGVTFYPDDAHDSETLMKNADQAMYAAKNLGRDRFSWFTASMQREAEERIMLANDLRDALATESLKVYFQPIVDLKSGRVVKAEALVRWYHPTMGNITPNRFIPIAEETGMITTLGNWVFKQSAIMAKKWVDWAVANGEEDFAKIIKISVNKSPKQFHMGSTYELWVEILQSLDLNPSHMVIEITEGLFLGDNMDMAKKLQRFRDVGMGLSLDDFGTGYSSLGYLKKYEVDYLKIDQSFVRGMMEEASDRAIAEAILAMAQRLKLDVVAEGIELESQRVLLAEAGCHYGQGYLFHKPLPAEEFLALVAPAPITA